MKKQEIKVALVRLAVEKKNETGIYVRQSGSIHTEEGCIWIDSDFVVKAGLSLEEVGQIEKDIDRVHPMPESKWVPVEEAEIEDYKTYLCASEIVKDCRGKGKIVYDSAWFDPEGGWIGVGEGRNILAIQEIHPYQPPVKFERGDLVEHDSGCRGHFKHRNGPEFLTVVLPYENEGETTACWKTKDCRKVEG